MTPHPPFLNALDNVTPVDDGYITDCPCCDLASRGREPGLIDIHPAAGSWRLHCDTCSHAAATAYLQLDEIQLATTDSRRAAIRAWHTLQLARTPEAWSQLLQGRPVPTDQLDPANLQRAQRRIAP